MHISPSHAAAVIAACRIPALHARLAPLAATPDDPDARATLAFYATSYPAEPGSPPGGEPIVTLTLSARAGVVSESLYQAVLDTPIEAQVTGAGASGDIPQWARVYTPGGDWWADLTVSVEGGGGEIQLVPTEEEGGQPVTRYFNGAFCRLASAVIQG